MGNALNSNDESNIVILEENFDPYYDRLEENVVQILMEDEIEKN